jgi:hypothetical protein
LRQVARLKEVELLSASPGNAWQMPFAGDPAFRIKVRLTAALPTLELGIALYNNNFVEIASSLSSDSLSIGRLMPGDYEIIAEFMRENPDVVVRVDVVSWQQYWAENGNGRPDRHGPGRLAHEPAYVEQYAAAGHLMNLTPFIEADPQFSLDDYFPFAFDDFCFAGQGKDLRPESVSYIHPLFLEKARKILEQIQCRNVITRLSDGTNGWKEEAPFDAIMVTAGSPSLPEPLMEQLKVGGTMVIPIGGRNIQRLIRVRRTAQGFQEENLMECSFVALVGDHGWPRREKYESYSPR